MNFLVQKASAKRPSLLWRLCLSILPQGDLRSLRSSSRTRGPTHPLETKIPFGATGLLNIGPYPISQPETRARQPPPVRAGSCDEGFNVEAA